MYVILNQKNGDDNSPFKFGGHVCDDLHVSPETFKNCVHGDASIPVKVIRVNGEN